ncbi:bifunctional molybdenum cofactor biosynthesis protein MoaC/MoaB [Aquimarina sp. MMG015]|uniref:bifunctional molybdenum cofactor biosynthesis protein MoaC/MoaB n=1 Tax=Aquimarina TaxID=290174 RepID=UPI00042378A3|nr:MULTISPECIES: bifunctional molybdenum cofactor biosynthesis protein MoaC/MoaB [Aquimarina]AXT55895.1 bifunctional molybdenum cofactor biosynthesis protein MoaC/MoaB [Aquimarina sp. AD1]MBQ4805336.1 bifunctional molybdenum cofactor biosynthesis protein MoaC/MoaB [Aquimarina sp. MMG015]RKN16705.1 bifunctional molybdenum cofactor biosynthesis protein MoaC/MoaB [Aquimarina sp. AD1]
MVDITHKNNTLRTAVAQAIVKVGNSKTIEAIISKSIPKGDVFEMAKTAGLFAVKRTSDMIPDCHPLPIEYTSIDYKINNLEIVIEMTVKTIYKTGVEVEAMHGVSVVALTMYDMLKPVDKNVEIRHIKLLKKRGGKSSYKDNGEPFKAGVVVCSDSISEGHKEDKAGKAIIEKLEECGVTISTYTIIPDEINEIQQQVKQLRENDLIIFTGGTGLSPRDVTPEALLPLVERRIPGIEEAIRTYGQNRMPYAMLSRSVAGVIGESLILALPGSTNGAKESMEAIFPAVLHTFRILKGAKHDGN